MILLHCSKPQHKFCIMLVRKNHSPYREIDSFPLLELDKITLRLWLTSCNIYPMAQSFSGSDDKSNRISRIPSPDSCSQSGSTITQPSDGSTVPGCNHCLHSAISIRGLFSRWLLSEGLSALPCCYFSSVCALIFSKRKA